MRLYRDGRRSLFLERYSKHNAKTVSRAPSVRSTGHVLWDLRCRTFSVHWWWYLVGEINLKSSNSSGTPSFLFKPGNAWFLTSWDLPGKGLWCEQNGHAWIFDPRAVLSNLRSFSTKSSTCGIFCISFGSMKFVGRLSPIGVKITISWVIVSGMERRWRRVRQRRLPGNVCQ